MNEMMLMTNRFASHVQVIEGTPIDLISFYRIVNLLHSIVPLYERFLSSSKTL